MLGQLSSTSSPVWSPVYKSDIRKIEAVQRRFTKRLKYCSHLSYAERLNYIEDENIGIAATQTRFDNDI